MSFVPAPQAPSSSSNANNNGQVTKAGATTAAPGAVTPEPEVSDYDLLFKLRTFDVYWVEKKALMYKDGFDKVSWLSLFFVLYCLPPCVCKLSFHVLIHFTLHTTRSLTYLV